MSVVMIELTFFRFSAIQVFKIGQVGSFLDKLALEKSRGVYSSRQVAERINK